MNCYRMPRTRIAQEVRFILREDRIEFEHDGERLFTSQDVDAITSIGFSTKRDDVTKIGKFGVGFKAVFAYTDSPEIESGDLHFRIRDMVVPEPDGVSKSFSRDSQTRFILPFNNPKKSPQRARSEIERLLKSLGATTLLFLTHIHKIEYLLPDSSLGYIERINLGESRFEIRLQQPSEFAPSTTWFMKFDKEAQVEDEEAENESPKVKSCRIAVALGLTPVEAKAGAKEKKSGSTDASPEWELVPMEPGRVCIYFPGGQRDLQPAFPSPCAFRLDRRARQCPRLRRKQRVARPPSRPAGRIDVRYPRSRLADRARIGAIAQRQRQLAGILPTDHGPAD